jgi:hypothetical protein
MNPIDREQTKKGVLINSNGIYAFPKLAIIEVKAVQIIYFSNSSIKSRIYFFYRLSIMQLTDRSIDLIIFRLKLSSNYLNCLNKRNGMSSTLTR